MCPPHVVCLTVVLRNVYLEHVDAVSVLIFSTFARNVEAPWSLPEPSITVLVAKPQRDK